MSGKKVNLSRRLSMLASMVTPGSSVADVGCDHGFLPIWLVQNGIVPHALAMDVRPGPLKAAKEHIESYGLEQYIDTRLSDGLKAYRAGEAQTVVCAGMGGRLMEKILREGADKVSGLKELILQPQSELREFRAFLRKNGFTVIKEDAVFEEGKYYFAMKVVPGAGLAERESSDIGRIDAAENENPDGGAKPSVEGQTLFDMFGKQLLLERHPVLRQYLIYRREIVSRLEAELPATESERTLGRRREIGFELVCLDRALQYFE